MVALAPGYLYLSQYTRLLNQIRGASKIRKDRYPVYTVRGLAWSLPRGDGAAILTIEKKPWAARWEDSSAC